MSGIDVGCGPLNRAVSLGSVVLLHIVAFWLFAALRPTAATAPSRELEVTVFNPQLTPQPPPPPLSWTFQSPEDVEVGEAEVTIISKPGDPDAIVASMAGQVVPPRLDSCHVNTLPDLPYGLN